MRIRGEKEIRGVLLGVEFIPLGTSCRLPIQIGSGLYDLSLPSEFFLPRPGNGSPVRNYQSLSFLPTTTPTPVKPSSQLWNGWKSYFAAVSCELSKVSLIHILQP